MFLETSLVYIIFVPMFLYLIGTAINKKLLWKTLEKRQKIFMSFKVQLIFIACLVAILYLLTPITVGLTALAEMDGYLGEQMKPYVLERQGLILVRVAELIQSITVVIIFTLTEVYLVIKGLFEIEN